MDGEVKTIISVQIKVNMPIETVWKKWTNPGDVIQWNYASNDWHTPHAENDLRVGGKFLSRMEAKDGSAGFDFEGIYDEVKLYKYIEYHMADGRKVKTTFTADGNVTNLLECFDSETVNPVEVQRAGWQSILDNFK